MLGKVILENDTSYTKMGRGVLMDNPTKAPITFKTPAVEMAKPSQIFHNYLTIRPSSRLP